MILLCLLLLNILFCPSHPAERNDADADIYEQCVKHLSTPEEQPTSKRMVRSALYFLGKPYTAATLEINAQEKLVINLREFDCTTLVENCLALSLTSKEAHKDYAAFKDNLQKIRYRKGIIEGYSSRLHYSSDWIRDNQAAGLLTDISKESGGVPIRFQLDYMSTHPQSYHHLANHPEDIPLFRKIEAAVNAATYHYIPKINIPHCQDNIQDGDIIFFVTSIKGLDISHTGIAYRVDGKLGFIHASSKAGKVIVDPDSLYDYCMKSKTNKGVIVCRPTPQ